MYKIRDVNFVEYYSNTVPKEIILDFLRESICDSKGVLKLTLKPGKDFKQEGPFVLPPIRWIDSFEYYAEFIIICDVR